MIYLLLAIITAAALVLLFKVFERSSIPVFEAIVFNYITATICAFIFLPSQQKIISGEIFHSSWIPFALFLGSLFFTIFNLTSITTIRYGVSTASIAMKLGLVFPVAFAFIFYGEKFTWLRLLGILLALVAVILSSLKDEETPAHEHHNKIAVLPLLVFIGSGACDSLTQFANKHYLSSSGMEEFSFFLFLAASATGIFTFVIRLVNKTAKLQWRSLLGGIILGTVNYFSFLFLLKALAESGWETAIVFPISNLGTVGVATVISIIFFREKLSRINFIGMLFAVASILVIVFSNR